MKRGFVRYIALAVAALLVCLLGVLAGWKLRGEVGTALTEDLRSFSVLEKGDAPAPVRAQVLQVLRRFQDGYLRRDPAQLEVFMQGLFPEEDPVLLLGTDSSEWVGGYGPVSSFIRTDWLHWGDVRLKVEDAVVNSQRDVAWVATVGQVGLGNSPRPIRFAAVLTRHEAGWLFRQVHFQWVEHGVSLSELLNPRTLLGLLRKTSPMDSASIPDK